MVTKPNRQSLLSSFDLLSPQHQKELLSFLEFLQYKQKSAVRKREKIFDVHIDPNEGLFLLAE